jgi:hypothetical protein
MDFLGRNFLVCDIGTSTICSDGKTVNYRTNMPEILYAESHQFHQCNPLFFEYSTEEIQVRKNWRLNDFARLIEMSTISP